MVKRVFIKKEVYAGSVFAHLFLRDKAPDQRTNTHTIWQIDSSLRGTMA